MTRRLSISLLCIALLTLLSTYALWRAADAGRPPTRAEVVEGARESFEWGNVSIPMGLHQSDESDILSLLNAWREHGVDSEMVVNGWIIWLQVRGDVPSGATQIALNWEGSNDAVYPVRLLARPVSLAARIGRLLGW